jgi:mRNA interferase MazF
VLSSDIFNRGPAELLIIVPLTTRERRIWTHVRIDPPEGGLRATSFAMCEDIRSISTQRLASYWGAIGADTMAIVEDRLRVLLNL